MKYPMINKQPRREVNIPQLLGGLNLRDSLTGVRDNQMTDCVNMWYKDGMLRTRPSFVTNEDMKIMSSLVYEDVYVTDLRTHSSVKNGEAVLVSCIDCDGSFEHGSWQSGISFFWQYPDKIIGAGYIEKDITREIVCKNSNELENAIEKSSRLVFEKDGYVYLFVSDKGCGFTVYKSQIADELKWDYINWDEYYVPTVYVHCKATNNGLDYIGTMFEGYNLFTDSYKMIYSTINLSDVEDGVTWMRYPYASKLPDNVETTIIARHTTKDGILCEHSAVWTGGKELRCYETTDKAPKDNLYLYVTGHHVHLVTEQGTNKIATVNKEDYIEDNLEIEVIVKPNKTDDRLKKIFNMTKSTWFGGAANGINGGSRLFLCGNTDENEKSLVVWSALNNPLYFPENNYAYVGDKSQGVTAFGQQGENLIIFKEKSTYYSYYAANDNITADDLINQSVVDYEANSVYFPMVQLNANIGCDCPSTVQLCRNRLVWANSDGNVYTLYSNNQYSERTIYKVSDMIHLALSKENDLKNAVSCDFEGHYLLGVGNKIYVMDYNSYGYQYASSYSKTEDSNALIPWYLWEFDNEKYAGKIFEIDNRLMLMNSFETNDGVALTFAILSMNEDVTNDKLLILNQETDEIVIVDNKINSRLQTKLFDFSAVGYLKNIDRVSIGFGNNGGEPINVSFVTDKGCESDMVTLVGDSTDERDTAYVSFKNFNPCIKAVRTFGVKIEREGPLVVDGLSMQYRLLGGVK